MRRARSRAAPARSCKSVRAATSALLPGAEQALEAAEESGGRIIAVSDDEILKMQKLLAANGVWVEPASAAGVAGLAHELERGKIDLKGKVVAAVCTGHGLKDPDIITKDMDKPTILPSEMGALEDYLAREK